MMSTRLVALICSVLPVLCSISAASAENFVFNGSLDSNLVGYSLASVPIGLSPKDGGSLGDSGSALIVNNYATKNNAQGISQCLHGFTFSSDMSLEVGGKVYFPTGQTNTGWVGIGLNWYTQPNCQTSSQTAGPRVNVRTPNTGFQPFFQLSGVPADAVSAMLVAYVTKAEDGGSLMAFVDDLYVVPVATTPNATQVWVPTASHSTGAAGTSWRTDLEIANPGTSTVSYAIDLLKKNQANPNPQRVTYSLNAGLTARYSDIVLSMFSFEGSGALRVTPTGGRLVVASRTYNQTSTGTYGQFVQGLPEGQAVVYGAQGRLVQLTQSTSTTTGYRTNIGFVNATKMPIHIDALLYSSTGASLGTVGSDLQAYDYQQVDRIFTKVPAGSVTDGFAILKTTTVGGRFFAYASVIDNATGDPVCVQVARR
jgi:hypothetical protein